MCRKTTVSDDVKRQKALEAENSRLKKLVAERDLEIEVMKEIRQKCGERTGTPRAGPLCDFARVEPAAACALIQVSRANLGYVSRMPGKNAAVIQAMQRLPGDYPRFGSRRHCHRQGTLRPVVGAGGAAGAWQAASTSCRRFAAAATCTADAYAVWSYDFVFDACANGQQLKCRTVVDEYTRECLAIDVAGSIRSARVIEVLSQLISVHSAPRYMRSDNVPNSSAPRCSGGLCRRRSSRR
jgi:putative transposase